MSIPPRDCELPMLLRQPGVFVRRYRLPLLFLLTGAGADMLTTIIALRRFGAGTEVHLVQRWVVQLAGVGAGVPLAKAIQIGFVLLVAAWWRPWCGWILGGCGALYSLAAISNHLMLL